MMKHLKHPVATLVALQSLLLFLILWSVWYMRYPYVIRWMESYTWWSDLSDLVSLGATMPADSLKVAGAWLMQFYYYPALGAALQSLLAVAVWLCGALIVVRLFRRAHVLLWLAYVPTLLFLSRQFWDHELDQSLRFLLVEFLLALLVLLVSCRVKRRLALPRLVANGYVATSATLLLLAWCPWQLLYGNRANAVHAYYCQLELLAEEQRWDDLLAIATPDQSQQNEIVRRFALLALIAKQRLTSDLFLYGIQSSDDFLFKDRDEPLCRHFNALFYRTLDMPNEVVHQSFQQQVQSTFGTSFGVLRQLAEAHLAMGNYPLARKYLAILSHSTVMRRWASQRQSRLAALRREHRPVESSQGQFYTSDLLVAMGAMSDRHPSDRRYADILLCGLLANKNGDEFYPAFKVIAQRQYAHGEPIPPCYEQALMLVAPMEPEVLRLFPVSRQTQQTFQQVMQLVQSGRQSQLPALVPYSFWAYFF